MTYQKHISANGADWSPNDFLYAIDLQNIENTLKIIADQIHKRYVSVNNFLKLLDIDFTKEELHNFLHLPNPRKSILLIRDNLNRIKEIKEELRPRKIKDKFLINPINKNLTQPNGRVEFGACLFQDSIYYGGGFYTNGSTVYDDFWELNLNQSSPTSLNNQGSNGGAFELIPYKNSLLRTPMIISPLNQSPLTIETNFRWYDIKSNTWSSKRILAEDRLRGAFELIGSDLYWIGGHNIWKSSLVNCSRIDLKNMTPESISSLPIALSSAQVVTIDENIWLINGWYWDAGFGYRGVLKYDIYEDQWSWIRDFPYFTRNHQIGLMGNCIQIIGGDTSPSTQTSLYNPKNGLITYSAQDDRKSGKLLKRNNRFLYLFGQNQYGGSIESLNDMTQTHFQIQPIYKDDSKTRSRFPSIGHGKYFYFSDSLSNWQKIDLTTNQIKSLTSLPVFGEDMNFVSYGRFIYLLSQGTNAYVYDTKLDTWHTTNIPLTDQKTFSSFQIDKFAYLIGSEDPNKISIELLDLKEESLIDSNYFVSGYAEPIRDQALVKSGDYLYGLGGYREDTSGLSNEILRINPDTLEITLLDYFASPFRKYPIQFENYAILLGGNLNSPTIFSPELYKWEANMGNVLEEIGSVSTFDQSWTRPLIIGAIHRIQNKIFLLASNKDQHLIIGTIENYSF